MQAFTAKACKLLQLALSFAGQIQKKADHDQLWAVTTTQSFVRARRAQRVFKKHLYRAKVANEMVQTERSYMRALGVALSVYRKAAERFVSPADLNVIFGNMEQLRTLNVVFWRELENRMRDWNVDTCLGDLFSTKLKVFHFCRVLLRLVVICAVYSQALHVPQDVLNEYIVYVQGYDNGLKLHDKLLLAKGSKDYARAMEECSHDEMSQGLTLGAFLILPVQRFPRYQLLLQDLIKHTAPNHPDRATLEGALAEVVKMCNAINDATRNSANFTALQKLERMFDSSSGLRLTEKPNRALKAEVDVQEMVLTRTSSGAGKFADRTILVFDDMMVCVKKNSNKDEGWHVEWRIDGSSAHIANPDPNATSFDLVEVRLCGFFARVCLFLFCVLSGGH